MKTKLKWLQLSRSLLESYFLCHGSQKFLPLERHWNSKWLIYVNFQFLMCISKVKRKQTILAYPLLICTWFLKNGFRKIDFDEIHFWSFSNYIFTACVACKIQVRNRPKIKFAQLDFWNSIFQKSSADQ